MKRQYYTLSITHLLSTKFRAPIFESCITDLLSLALYLAFTTVVITRFQELPDVHINSAGSFPREKQISSLSCAWQHPTFTSVHLHCLSQRCKATLGPNSPFPQRELQIWIKKIKRLCNSSVAHQACKTKPILFHHIQIPTVPVKFNYTFTSHN